MRQVHFDHDMHLSHLSPFKAPASYFVSIETTDEVRGTPKADKISSENLDIHSAPDHDKTVETSDNNFKSQQEPRECTSDKSNFNHKSLQYI